MAKRRPNDAQRGLFDEPEPEPSYDRERYGELFEKWCDGTATHEELAELGEINDIRRR